jgi:intergrase/recombinase
MNYTENSEKRKFYEDLLRIRIEHSQKRKIGLQDLVDELQKEAGITRGDAIVHEIYRGTDKIWDKLSEKSLEKFLQYQERLIDLENETNKLDKLTEMLNDMLKERNTND